MIKKRTSLDKLNCIVLLDYSRRGEKGEDAWAFDIQREDAQMLAVFDGCGGSGAWRYPEFRYAKGAFVAAHTMANSCLSWFQSLTKDGLNDPKKLLESLQKTAEDELKNLKNSCAPMGISGTLVRSFPCTMSAAIMKPSHNQTVDLLALNIGDSRVYYLTPENGLVQLTKDDARGNPDAFENLRMSAPHADVLDADHAFVIKATNTGLTLPCAVLAASDGVFGFLRSPMDFEYLVLDCLMRAKSFCEFEQLFNKEIAEITGDDSTCVMAFYGWKGFDQIKKLLSPRHAILQEYVNRMDAAGDNLEEEYKIARQIWDSYKKTAVYEELLRNS